MDSESETFGQLSQSNRSSSSQEREIISSPRKSSSSSSRSRSNRMGRETEEEAIIRRFHDAQRMARFRARKKKALEDKQLQQQQATKDCEAEARSQQQALETESKYSQLLAIIERIGRDVRLSYAGSRTSAERLKSGIVRARALVRDCLMETRINLRQ